MMAEALEVGGQMQRFCQQVRTSFYFTVFVAVLRCGRWAARCSTSDSSGHRSLATALVQHSVAGRRATLLGPAMPYFQLVLLLPSFVQLPLRASLDRRSCNPPAIPPRYLRSAVASTL